MLLTFQRLLCKLFLLLKGLVSWERLWFYREMMLYGIFSQGQIKLYGLPGLATPFSVAKSDLGFFGITWISTEGFITLNKRAGKNSRPHCILIMVSYLVFDWRCWNLFGIRQVKILKILDGVGLRKFFLLFLLDKLKTILLR